MKNLMIRLWKEEEGQDLVEYGLTVALVGLAATAGMNSLATAINNAFSKVGSTLSSAVGGGGGGGY
ncbi:MAG TPA: Flp family type IVb pilin [Candidatus Acidoferrales bacterium]|jgi:pilus assembly protein Flp/PilA|nr:Flp family type IVb pilin [Candidatus Acidoferrales bacterium]